MFPIFTWLYPASPPLTHKEPQTKCSLVGLLLNNSSTHTSPPAPTQAQTRPKHCQSDKQHHSQHRASPTNTLLPEETWHHSWTFPQSRLMPPELLLVEEAAHKFPRKAHNFCKSHVWCPGLLKKIAPARQLGAQAHSCRVPEAQFSCTTIPWEHLVCSGLV